MIKALLRMVRNLRKAGMNCIWVDAEKPNAPLAYDFKVASTDALLTSLKGANPVMLKEALVSLMNDGISFNQYELIQRASNSAIMRSEKTCPFCHQDNASIAAKASESRCWWCLRENSNVKQLNEK